MREPVISDFGAIRKLSSLVNLVASPCDVIPRC